MAVPNNHLDNAMVSISIIGGVFFLYWAIILVIQIMIAADLFLTGFKLTEDTNINFFQSEF